MALKEGDEVQSMRELRCGDFGKRVGKGKKGVVYKVTWGGKYHVRFEDGTKCEDLSDEDIKNKGWW
jgi:hypothetical protein